MFRPGDEPAAQLSAPRPAHKRIRMRDDRDQTAGSHFLGTATVDFIVGEIQPPVSGSDWKSDVRRRILSARRALLRHPWASRVIESRPAPTPVVLAYLDSLIGMFRTGGFSVDLTHHVMHALGSRMWGFTQELFNNPPSVDPESQAVMLREMAGRYPYATALAIAVAHDDESIVGSGCDDQFEFEFALDLLLDGFERLQQQGWTSTNHVPRGASA
jgi:hypothetical protein